MGLYTFQYSVFFIYSVIAVGYATFSVKSFEDCNPGFDYPIKIDASFKTANKKQYLDVDTVLPAPLDDSTQLNITVDGLIKGDGNAIRLLSDVEKDTCTTLHKYFGQFIFDIERLSKIEPGVCPIPKGTYHLHDYLLDFEKFSIAQNFPLANIRIVIEATSTKDNSMMFCKIIIVKNVSK